jgi:hypothetical protein
VGGARPGRWQSERGAVSVASIFFVLLLGFFLALAINVGRLTRTRGDLQHAADSAALAAAAQLDDHAGSNSSGHAGDLKRGAADFEPAADTSSPAWAQRFAETTQLTTGANVSFNRTTDLRFGFWHTRNEHCAFGGGSCVAGFEDAPSPIAPISTVDRLADFVTVNAVRAEVTATLPNVLGYFAGTNSPTVRAVSTALTRRSSARCPIPVAIPTCRPPQDTSQLETPIDWGSLSTPPQTTSSPGNLTCSAGFDEIFFFSGELNRQRIGQPGGSWNMSPPTLRMGLYESTTTGNGNALTLARVDLLGEHTAAGLPDDLGEFVRQKTNGVIACGPPVGTGSPGTYATTSLGTEGSLAPFIDGLLGVDADRVKRHDCLLGQHFMVPLVKPPNNDCSNWPFAHSPGDDLVVGYVEVVFDHVRCAAAVGTIPEGQVFLSPPGAANYAGPPAMVLDCEVNRTTAEACTQSVPGGGGGHPDGYLQVHAQFRCLPEPEPDSATTPSRTRLVQ